MLSLVSLIKICSFLPLVVLCFEFSPVHRADRYKLNRSDIITVIDHSVTDLRCLCDLLPADVLLSAMRLLFVIMMSGSSLLWDEQMLLLILSVQCFHIALWEGVDIGELLETNTVNTVPTVHCVLAMYQPVFYIDGVSFKARTYFRLEIACCFRKVQTSRLVILYSSLIALGEMTCASVRLYQLKLQLNKGVGQHYII